MPKKRSVDALKVYEPCTQDWEDMTGNEKVRFCSHCQLSVNNISEMTQTEAMRLVRNSSKRICVRYIKHPKTQAPVFADKLYKITRRAGIAAGVLSASLAASAVSYAQGGLRFAPESSQKTAASNSEKAKFTGKTGEISGVITDSTGAVIPGAIVKLSNKKFNLQVGSNDTGDYYFKNVPPGAYEITAESVGFKTFVKDLKVEDFTEQKFDITLEVSEITMGVIAIVEPSLPLLRAIFSDEIESAINLIAKGADVNAKDEELSLQTALHAAVERNNLKIARYLINAGADVNAKDIYEVTPVMMIYDDTSEEIIKLLVQNGANLNFQDKERKTTALINAAENNNFKIMKILIEAGADVNLRDLKGNSVLDLTKDPQIRQLLITYGAEQKIEKPD